MIRTRSIISYFILIINFRRGLLKTQGIQSLIEIQMATIHRKTSILKSSLLKIWHQDTTEDNNTKWVICMKIEKACTQGAALIEIYMMNCIDFLIALLRIKKAMIANSQKGIAASQN